MTKSRSSRTLLAITAAAAADQGGVAIDRKRAEFLAAAAGPLDPYGDRSVHGLDDQHVALGRHFGQLEGHPHLVNQSELPPEIFELKASAGGVADEWHTDLTFQERSVANEYMSPAQQVGLLGQSQGQDLADELALQLPHQEQQVLRGESDQ